MTLMCLCGNLGHIQQEMIQSGCTTQYGSSVRYLDIQRGDMWEEHLLSECKVGLKEWLDGSNVLPVVVEKVGHHLVPILGCLRNDFAPKVIGLNIILLEHLYQLLLLEHIDAHGGYVGLLLGLIGTQACTIIPKYLFLNCTWNKPMCEPEIDQQQGNKWLEVKLLWKIAFLFLSSCALGGKMSQALADGFGNDPVNLHPKCDSQRIILNKQSKLGISVHATFFEATMVGR